MQKIAVISDIHGCYNTLLALIARIPGNYEIVFAGDLIDRGPDSKSVVDFAMKNKIRCVMGNHEDLMLFHHRRFEKGMPYRDRQIWLWNGGRNTLASYMDTKVPDDALNWVAGLPFAIREGDFEISHTGWGGFDKASREVKLWIRHGSDAMIKENDGVFRIFGHTQREEPWITDHYAMIDTGCAYKDRGLGKLTAFLIPEKAVIQQECIDL